MNPAWPLPIQRLIGDTSPSAYALWDDQDRRRQFVAGNHWHFELTLIGELALRQIPAVGGRSAAGRRAGDGAYAAAKPGSRGHGSGPVGRE